MDYPCGSCKGLDSAHGGRGAVSSLCMWDGDRLWPAWMVVKVRRSARRDMAFFYFRYTRTCINIEISKGIGKTFVNSEDQIVIQ